MLDPISSRLPESGPGIAQQLQSQQQNVQRQLNAADADESDPEMRKAFDEFVGQTFYGTLLKELRKSEQGAAYMNGGRAEKVFRGQLDQLLVERMTEASAETFSGPMFDLVMANRNI